MRNAIVTGANGFIGRFLVRELIRQNVEVTAIVRETTNDVDQIREITNKVVRCDLCNYSLLPKLIADRNIDCIFHIAWQGVSNQMAQDSEIQLMNIKATLDLLDAAHEMQIQTFVGAGSVHEVEALVEMNAEKPITNLGYMYKSAKIAAHFMGKAKAGNYGIRFFWPLINTYGEEEKSARLINTVIRKIYKGESPILSSGEQYYDFVHVSDVARALYLIAEKGIDGTNYIVGSGDAKPLKDFLEIVGSTANQLNGHTAIPLGFGKIHSNVIYLPKSMFDISKLRADTGFVSQVSFEEGIRRTAEWIKKYDKNYEGD